MLLVDTLLGGTTSLSRRPPVPAGSVGTARLLYPGATLALFESSRGVRVVVPLASLRMLGP
jgi:hypothetical protein